MTSQGTGSLKACNHEGDSSYHLEARGRLIFHLDAEGRLIFHLEAEEKLIIRPVTSEAYLLILCV